MTCRAKTEEDIVRTDHEKDEGEQTEQRNGIIVSP